jgi:hypothetical protein
MRDRYDFSKGVIGKYAGKIEDGDIEMFDAMDGELGLTPKKEEPTTHVPVGDLELQAIRDVAHMSGRISVNALKEIMARARTPDEQADHDAWIIAVLQRKRALELEHDLRSEWWLNHHCGQLAYGDDGEMQCCMVDFKRTRIDELRTIVEGMRLKNIFAAVERAQLNK